MTIDLAHYAVLAAILFSIGLAGLAVRRSFLSILMCVELMINAGNLMLVAAARRWADPAGHALVLFVVAIAAAEAAVGLAIAVNLHRARGTAEPDALCSLKG